MCIRVSIEEKKSRERERENESEVVTFLETTLWTCQAPQPFPHKLVQLPRSTTGQKFTDTEGELISHGRTVG